MVKPKCVFSAWRVIHLSNKNDSGRQFPLLAVNPLFLAFTKHSALVAQLVEHQAVMREVTGSNLAWIITEEKVLSL